jgi:hypothetical protein
VCRSSFSSKRSEKWAEVDIQVSGSVGISDSYWGSKKECTVGKMVDFNEIFFFSSSREAVKSKAAP